MVRPKKDYVNNSFSAWKLLHMIILLIEAFCKFPSSARHHRNPDADYSCFCTFIKRLLSTILQSNSTLLRVERRIKQNKTKTLLLQ